MECNRGMQGTVFLFFRYSIISNSRYANEITDFASAVNDRDDKWKQLEHRRVRYKMDSSIAMTDRLYELRARVSEGNSTEIFKSL